MRAAHICFIFVILIRRGIRADNEFRPTPIPLSEWRGERGERGERAGTLHETLHTAAPPAAAALPKHYWEDALRHSVYLTLVRDKIDQLIANGDVISPNTKPDHFISKEVDDHDLWEKIKTAPFDRINGDEPSQHGEVTIMAKGRLMEEKNGFRFSEDERSKEKCGDDECMQGVKAFWSVKRVRQREVETFPGRYHYELTFSVISQHPKKQRQPYENPVRTFTVKESSPDQVLDMPIEHRAHDRPRIVNHTLRPARAIWVHRNIVPTPYSQSRQYGTGLDRIFSSFFSDEDDDYVPPRPAYRPPPHFINPMQQYSKIGYVGQSTDQQKRLTPYPYKPHTYKYSRPIPPPSFQHSQHYHAEADSNGHPYATPPEYRYGPSTKPNKTTRPAVLPTPLPPITPPKNWTEADSTSTSNETEIITKGPEFFTSHRITRPISRPGPGSMKINYLSDHVRPPIYTAPPGVFVTMDKKPFKPMPPLKYVTKPLKHYKPIDFRPSPQVLDMQQFSEPDPLHPDTAFRPMTWNLHANVTTTEKIEVAETTTKDNSTRKTHPKGKKPPKKHENIKASRITTPTPDIITASSDSEEESDAMQWANVVGSFIRTTPMASEKQKTEAIETTKPTTTTSSTASTTTVGAKRRTTTTTETVKETTTTAKPKPKRTRPPPKFSKPDKPKKHKRVTTTKAPEVKVTPDLTPQASSAAATKPAWTATNKTQSTSTTATTTTTSSTTKPTTTTKTTTTTTTTTTTPAPTTAHTKSSSSTTQPKIKNRFRQSTLLTKGTSVNHDRWSAQSVEKVKPTGPVAPEKIPPRRKGSNFHGYISSTTPRNEVHNEKFHEDHGMIKTLTVKPLSTTTPSYEETADQYESNSETSDYVTPEEEEDLDEDVTDEEESRDHTEYIFQASTTPSERTNEVDHEPITTEQTISTPKNKTKCKKKKLSSTTPEETFETVIPIEITTPAISTTTKTTSIFEELFGSFSVDDHEAAKESQTAKPDLQEEGSEKHGHFVKLDDDLQEFLDSLEKGKSFGDDHYDDNDDDTEPEIDDVEEEETSRSNWTSEDKTYDRYDHDDYEDKEPRNSHDSPFSLLELLAME